MRLLAIPLALLIFASVALADDAKVPEGAKTPKLAVRDGLSYFSPEAIAAATRLLGKVRERYHIDLFLETTDQMPEPTEFEKKAWIKSKAQKDARESWATNRADALRNEGIAIDGLYVVVMDAGPGKRDVRVVPWPAGREADIHWHQRDQLRALLLDLFRAPDQSRRDHILERASEWFLAQAKEMKDPRPSPLSAHGAYFVCLCLAGGWVGLMLFRWRFNARLKPGDPVPVEIYQPAMMGTLFGVPAAFWVNDELFRVIPPEVTPVTVTPSDNFSLPMPSASNGMSDKPSGV